jgi:hypothetical protein
MKRRGGEGWREEGERRIGGYRGGEGEGRERDGEKRKGKGKARWRYRGVRK